MVICVPSRGRPERLWKFIRSAMATDATCKFYIRVDDDDPCLSAYRERMDGLNVGPRVSVAEAMQEALRSHPDEDCYALIGDDTILHTRHWDKILNRAAGRWFISYPDDCLAGESQATHPFIGGDFLRAIGFWALPGLSHLYTDTTWDFLGRKYANLIYRPDVLVEHIHWSSGKCDRDTSYAKPTAAKDKACFMQWSGKYQIDPILCARIAASAEARPA